MGSEGDIIESDGWWEAVVAERVLGADDGIVVEGPVGQEVGEEAYGLLGLRFIQAADMVGLGGKEMCAQRESTDGRETEDIPRALMKGKSIVVPTVDLRR